MNLNRPLIEKMIVRIEAKPRGYDQNAFYAVPDNKAPCGTVACLAGEAAICSKDDEIEGQRFAVEGEYDPHELIGCCSYGQSRHDCSLFVVRGYGWPEPFRSAYPEARTVEARAKVAADLLREVLRTDGKILEQ